MNKIKYLFIDFNGTLLDDRQLCLDLLNDFLTEQNKRLIDMETYKNIFGFPIKNYYIKAGLTFEKESYESMAIRFIDQYKKLSLNCKLYDDVKDTLRYLKDKDIKLIMLSASEKNNLLFQTNYYNITDYFDEILGIDDIYANSKEEIGINYIKENNIDLNECLFIGDTTHDFEVAQKMGVKPLLVLCGHQSKKILDKLNVKLINSFNDIKEII
ncbi:MAG: HAD-IA family hydrolase [Acholeplasmatales bacterium]|nr:HAD-IA family hydrolase [Acholeplasmatales bacterium]